MKLLYIALSCLLLMNCSHRTKLSTLSTTSDRKPTLSKVREIKDLYLQLADQLDNSPTTENKDLSKLARAVGETPDREVAAFAQSKYVGEVSQALDSKKDKLPALLTDNQTRAAAIGMISLGVISLGYSVYGLKDWNQFAVNRFNPTKHASFVLGIASLVFGSLLMADPNNKKKEADAKKVVLTSGILSVIFGLEPVIRSLYPSPLQSNSPKTNGFQDLYKDIENIRLYTKMDSEEFRKRLGVAGLGGYEAVHRLMSLPDDLPETNRIEAQENYKKSMQIEGAKGLATIAFGATLIVASQSGLFNTRETDQLELQHNQEQTTTLVIVKRISILWDELAREVPTNP